MTSFRHLFAPLELRHRTLESRLVFGARTANMAEGGLPSERHRAYYEERARTAHDAAITAWHGDGAEIVDLRDGTSRRPEADALVLATVNQAQTWLQDELADGTGAEVHAIGDCVAPRLAVMAVYEGRELALRR